ncbi:MAG: polysaccharide biosynthesis protein [Thomasclavelia spiroformis]
MTRFVMTLEEAVDLVLFAFENGESGDILFKKHQLVLLKY